MLGNIAARRADGRVDLLKSGGFIRNEPRSRMLLGFSEALIGDGDGDELDDAITFCVEDDMLLPTSGCMAIFFTFDSVCAASLTDIITPVPIDGVSSHLGTG